MLSISVLGVSLPSSLTTFLPGLADLPIGTFLKAMSLHHPISFELTFWPFR